MKTNILAILFIIIITAGCTTVERSVTPANRAMIRIPPKPAIELTAIPISSPNIKKGTKAGAFALVPIPVYLTELKGSNEVRVNNPNNFPALVMIRCEEKGIHIEMPARSTTSIYLPNGAFQISFIFANVPNAIMRGDHIHLPALDRLEINIPISSGD
jgi:hypothetical protein